MITSITTSRRSRSRRRRSADEGLQERPRSSPQDGGREEEAEDPEGDPSERAAARAGRAVERRLEALSPEGAPDGAGREGEREEERGVARRERARASAREAAEDAHVAGGGHDREREQGARADAFVEEHREERRRAGGAHRDEEAREREAGDEERGRDALDRGRIDERLHERGHEEPEQDPRSGALDRLAEGEAEPVAQRLAAIRTRRNRSAEPRARDRAGDDRGRQARERKPWIDERRGEEHRRELRPASRTSIRREATEGARAERVEHGRGGEGEQQRGRRREGERLERRAEAELARHAVGDGVFARDGEEEGGAGEGAEAARERHPFVDVAVVRRELVVRDDVQERARDEHLEAHEERRWDALRERLAQEIAGAARGSGDDEREDAGAGAALRGDDPPDREPLRDAMQRHRDREHLAAVHVVPAVDVTFVGVERDAVDERVEREAEDEEDVDGDEAGAPRSLEPGREPESQRERDDGARAELREGVGDDVERDDAGDGGDDEAVEPLEEARAILGEVREPRAERDSGWTGVVRSKGFFWLASRMEITGSWSQAGGSATAEPAGVWYATLPRREWPEDPETRRQIEADWEEPWGDRRQELVFIGARMDRGALLEGLAQSLLTDAEMKRGPKAWRTMRDPFPSWTG